MNTTSSILTGASVDPCKPLFDQASNHLVKSGVVRPPCTEVALPIPATVPSTVDSWSWTSMLHPSMLAAALLVLCLIVLAGYTVFVEKHLNDEHDYRYFQRISIRRWLWGVYLAILFVYFVFVL